MATSPRFLSVKDVPDELAITETAVYTLLKTAEVPAIQGGPKRVRPGGATWARSAPPEGTGVLSTARPRGRRTCPWR
jgi:hypothetical protein